MQLLGQLLACLVIMFSILSPECLNLTLQELYDLILFHIIAQLVIKLAVLLCACLCSLLMHAN
jgi:hypothetical protein